MDEFDIITQLLRPLATHPAALHLRDDACWFSVENQLCTASTASNVDSTTNYLVISSDTLVEHVHFIGTELPQTLAHKALAVNLSDIAAKGATPLGYQLMLSLPPHTTKEWLQAFAAGLLHMQTRYSCSLLGGDTTRSNTLTISVTMLGTSTMQRTRSTAAIGDVVYVSGTLGAGAFGLLAAQHQLPALSAEHRDRLINHYQSPTPRCDLSSIISHHANASMDISDGIHQDACHIANNSQVSLRLDASALPYCPAVRAATLHYPEYAALPLYGGDDYELLFTSSHTELASSSHDITAIGRVVERTQQPIIWENLDANSQQLLAHTGGYTHHWKDA